MNDHHRPPGRPDQSVTHTGLSGSPEGGVTAGCSMQEPNPYRSPAVADHRPPDRDRLRAVVVAVALLDVVFSACKIVWNLPGLRSDPESSAGLIGGILIIVMAWTAAELFAARLIWRGHAAGRWILVVSFGLKAIGQIGTIWPMLIRDPSLILSWPWLKFAVQGVCYGAAAVGLLLLPRFEKRSSTE
jgi:hypothetical protein